MDEHGQASESKPALCNDCSMVVGRFSKHHLSTVVVECLSRHRRLSSFVATSPCRECWESAKKVRTCIPDDAALSMHLIKAATSCRPRFKP
jgi:hypothetical protein